MELKIQCNCGTKFKFEFEPVNGRVPFQVVCPTCKADATEFANDWVAQQLGIPAPAYAAAAEPAPAAPPPTEPGRPKLSIRSSSHAPAAATAVAEPQGAVSAPVAAPAPKRAFIPNSAAYSNLTPADEGLTAKFFYGVAGAAAGTALGCLIWYLIFHFSGVNLRLFALLVGAGGGFGARICSKDEGSSQLGMITCVIVLCGIVFTAYNIGKDRVHGFADKAVNGIFKEQVDYAKRAIQAVPNGSDDEIRAFLAKEESGDSGEKTKPTDIPAHEIRLFREVRLEHYKQLVDGKINPRDYPKTFVRWVFDEQVAEAKWALEAMPHESDKEIRTYLATQAGDTGEKPNLEAISADEVSTFKNKTLPEYKKLASGEKQYEELPDALQNSDKALDKAEEETGWMRVLYFFAGWGIGGIFLMFGTLGLAYKTCTHASG